MGESKYRKATDPSYGKLRKDEAECGEASNLSIRARNLAFLDLIADTCGLQADHSVRALTDYKKAFTPSAVRRLNEGIVKLWPKSTDIVKVLHSVADGGVSALYVGDYAHDQLMDAVVRHSTYVSKLLIVDPFVYPLSVRDEYNPVINPAKHRAQTLRNVNLWLKLAPWIKAGIVQIIRTPCDFDHRLQWDLMEEQREKFDSEPELAKAAEESIAELMRRHSERMKFRDLVLAAPDDSLLRDFERMSHKKTDLTKEGFLAHINQCARKTLTSWSPWGRRTKGSFRL